MMINEIVKYEQQFEEIRCLITMHRERALRSVNEEPLQMSWTLGEIVSERLKANEWGSKVVTQLAEYLRTKDPTLKGYSRRNIYNMVMFFDEYSSGAFNERLQNISLPDFVQAETAQMENKSSVVEYAMSRSLSPTMVAEYHRQLIPKDVIQKSLNEFCSFLFESK